VCVNLELDSSVIEPQVVVVTCYTSYTTLHVSFWLQVLASHQSCQHGTGTNMAAPSLAAASSASISWLCHMMLWWWSMESVDMCSVNGRT